MGDAKEQIMSSFKTNPTKDYDKPERAKNVYGRGNKPSKLEIQNQSEDNIIKTLEIFLE